MQRIEAFHRRLIDSGPQGVPEHLGMLLLRLLALIYSGIVRLRNDLFDRGLRNTFRSRLPVISVGNLAVGGTGKTPLVDLLVRHLLQKDLRVAVVSRGYGGTFKGKVGIVSLGSGNLMTAAEAGDEPCLLARRNPGVRVLVARKRSRAIRRIEAQDLADLVILDDGFQHRQVERDLDLLLLDKSRPFGNGHMLPAGLLREPLSALARADLVCLSGEGQEGGLPRISAPVVKLCARLEDQARGFDGELRPLREMASLRVLAFAGIARPERYFAALEGQGITVVKTLALGDHARYDREQLRIINAAAGAAGVDVLLTTEKDAVKLTAEDFVRPCYSVGLHIAADENSPLFQSLDALIEKRMNMSLSQELLDILACPKCKGEVSLQPQDDQEVIVCQTCQLIYPVRDGIPVMLIDEARKLNA